MDTYSGTAYRDKFNALETMMRMLERDVNLNESNSAITIQNLNTKNASLCD